MEVILEEGTSRVELFPGFWPSNFIDQLEAIPLQQRQIKMFGKVHNEPRMTTWFGPAYSYSGISLDKKPISKALSPLLDEVSDTANKHFNGVLINRYQNGKHYMGWHRDNEKEIDQSVIASVSFGATRRFKIRHRKSKDVWNIELGDGDLLLMHNIQDKYEHCLPKSALVHDVRFNLTFRHIVPAGKLC